MVLCIYATSLSSGGATRIRWPEPVSVLLAFRLLPRPCQRFDLCRPWALMFRPEAATSWASFWGGGVLGLEVSVGDSISCFPLDLSWFDGRCGCFVGLLPSRIADSQPSTTLDSCVVECDRCCGPWEYLHGFKIRTSQRARVGGVMRERNTFSKLVS